MDQPNQPIQQNITPDPQPEVSIKPSLPKWGLILIIIAGIIVISTAGYAAYKYFSPEPDPDPIACASDAKTCPDGSSVGRVAPDCEFTECPEVVDPTADWQTYKNETYDYETKYPESLSVTDWTDIRKQDPSLQGVSLPWWYSQSLSYIGLGDGTSWKGDDRDRITIEVYNTDLEEITGGASFMSSARKKRTTQIIDGKQAVRFSDSVEGAQHVEINMIFSGRHYIFTAQGDTEIELLDQILSTFKFIEVDPMTGWQTYQNEELGFSFKQPDDFGEVIFEVQKGDTGKSFEGSFIKNDHLTFSGRTENFSLGRGAYFADFVKYKKEGNKYFHVWRIALTEERKEEIEPIVMSSDSGIEILKVDRYSYVEERDLEGPTINPGPNALGALINLSKGDFPGIAFWLRDKNEVSEDTFNQILSTFKFIE